MIRKSMLVALNASILALAGPVAAAKKAPVAKNSAIKAALIGLDACFLDQTSIDPNHTRLSRALVSKAGFVEQKRNPYQSSWVWAVPGVKGGKEGLVDTEFGIYNLCSVTMSGAVFTPDSVKVLVTRWANAKGLKPFATTRPGSLIWTRHISESGRVSKIAMADMHPLAGDQMQVSVQAFYSNDAD